MVNVAISHFSYPHKLHRFEIYWIVFFLGMNGTSHPLVPAMLVYSNSISNPSIYVPPLLKCCGRIKVFRALVLSLPYHKPSPTRSTLMNNIYDSGKRIEC
jgi:hypothetical protein